MTSVIQTKRTAIDNTPPADGSLQPGELVVEMGLPNRLWVGVPAAQDPSGKKLLSSSVIVMETPPLPATQGLLWYESDSGILWMHYVDPTGGQWVQVNGTGGGGGTVDAYTKAESDAKFVDAAGDAMNGSFSIYPSVVGGSALLSLLGSGAGNNDINGYNVPGQVRWIIRLGDSTPEGGSDLGSDFHLIAFDDAVVGIKYTLSVNRASGLGTVYGDPVAPLGIATKQYVDNNAGGGFEAGTTMLFYQAAAPLGWTQITTEHNKGLRVTSGAGGVAGGTNPFTTVMAQTVVGNHSLTAAQSAWYIVYPNGTIGQWFPYNASNWGSFIGSAGSGYYIPNSNAAGTTGGEGMFPLIGAVANQNHNHTIMMDMQYLDVILARKD